MRWPTVVLGLIIGTVFYLVLAGLIALPLLQVLPLLADNVGPAALLLIVALQGIALRAVLPVQAAIRFADRPRLLRAVALHAADAPGWWQATARTESHIRYTFTQRFNLVRFEDTLTITFAADNALIVGPRRRVRLLVRWLEAEAAAESIPLTDAALYTPPGIAIHLHRDD